MKRDILIILLLSSFAIAPLFNRGFFFPHDNEYHLLRLIELDRCIKENSYYPRIFPDLASGYGYAVLNYYPPLVYYIAELFHLLGFGFFDSIKAVYMLGFILAGIAMYVFAREIIGDKAAVLAALAYIYAPYHIVDIYVRGALAEFFSFIFFPLILWCFHKRKLIMGAVFYAMLIAMHNISAFIFFPFSFLYIIITKKLKFREYAFLILLALSLSSFYWIPAIGEKDFVMLKNFGEGYKNHFVYFSQLFSTNWGYGFSVAGYNDEMPFQVGLLHLYAALLSILLLRIGRKLDKKFKENLLFFWSIMLISVFLMLDISNMLWKLLPFFEYIQFPWRFLIFVALSTSFFYGSALKIFNEKRFAFLLLLIIVLSYAGYCKANYADVSESVYSPAKIRMLGLKASASDEFLPIWAKAMPEKPAKAIAHGDNVKIEIIESKCLLYRLKALAYQRSEITMNLFYFPGYAAYIDGERKQISYDETGLITLEIPSGKHEIILKFEDTFLRFLGKLITTLSFFSLIILQMVKVYLREA